MSGGRTDSWSRERVKAVDLVAIVEAQKAAAEAVEVAAGTAPPGTHHNELLNSSFRFRLTINVDPQLACS